MKRHAGRKVCGSSVVSVGWKLLCKSYAPGWQDQQAGLHSAPAPKAVRMPKHGSSTLDSAL